MNESFRVLGPSAAQGEFAFLKNALSRTVMDVIGGEHCDPGTTMLGVVPREEGSNVVRLSTPGFPSAPFICACGPIRHVVLAKLPRNANNPGLAA